jgi:hypothetical protein
LEVFTRLITQKDLHKPCAPSIKANYVNSRSEFGLLGTLMEDAFLMDVVGSHDVRDLYETAVCQDSNSDEISDENLLYLRVSPEFRTRVDARAVEVWEGARERARDEEANTTLVALPEALKVRVISKGPPYTYFTLKPVQKFLHSQMRKLRAFSLVGETVTAKRLSEVFRDTTGMFHSLDYQSATDLLDPAMSAAAVDGICDSVGMPEDIRKLFHKALTGHLVESVPQVWGQLMGSIVSFIVLCVVNAAVIRHAYEIAHEREFLLSEIPMLVNGDDGLVRSTERFAEIWSDVARVAGLIPSVGKVYSDDVYVNINSTSYNYINEEFVLIPYVNMGLVMGMTRSGGKQTSTSLVDRSYENPWSSSIGSKHHALLDNCPPDKVLATHELFLKHNADTLKSFAVPWYIPEWLGGVGLKPLIRVSYGENVDDPLVRTYLRTSTGHRCGPSRLDVAIAESFATRRNREFSVKKVPTSQPIQARSVWQKFVNAKFAGRQHVVMDESDETFLDLSTYYMTPSLVAKKLEDSSVFEAVHRNKRAWSSMLGLMSDYSSSGEDLFFGDAIGLRSPKSNGVKPLRLRGADPITHRPLYTRE